MWDRFKGGDLVRWRNDAPAAGTDWQGDVYVVVEARNLLDPNPAQAALDGVNVRYQELVVMGGDGQTHEIEDGYMVHV